MIEILVRTSYGNKVVVIGCGDRAMLLPMDKLRILSDRRWQTRWLMGTLKVVQNDM